MYFVDQQLVALLVFTTGESAFMTTGPSLRTEEASLRISSKGGSPSEQAGQKHLCQYAGQPGKVLKLGIQMGDLYCSSNKLRKWWTGMASKGCDVGRRDLTIIKTERKGDRLNNMQ